MQVTPEFLLRLSSTAYIDILLRFVSKEGVFNGHKCTLPIAIQLSHSGPNSCSHFSSLLGEPSRNSDTPALLRPRRLLRVCNLRVRLPTTAGRLLRLR